MAGRVGAAEDASCRTPLLGLRLGVCDGARANPSSDNIIGRLRFDVAVSGPCAELLAVFMRRPTRLISALAGDPQQLRMKPALIGGGTGREIDDSLSID